MRHLKIGVFATLAFVTASAFQNCAPSVSFLAQTASEEARCVDVSKPEVRPSLLWDWKTELKSSPAPHYETFDQVMASPMVADLDGDSMPEVVFVSFSVTASDIFADSPGRTYRGNGVLRILNGQTGQTKLSISSPELSPLSAQSPLLMDIDGDGKVEIFYVHYTSKYLIAVNHDGTLRWRYTLPALISMPATGVTGANLHNSGTREVSVGSYIVSEDATKSPYLKATLEELNSNHATSLAMPLNPDKPLNWSVVTHRGIFTPSGTRIGQAFPDGVRHLAAADIAPDIPGIEIIATGNEALYILNGLTGAVIQNISLAAYNDLKCTSGVIGGGPPSVGDFDGDGSTLEIAVATGRHLTIFDHNGQPKYKTVTQDCSSRVTGLTSFDMNGDNKPEILYADEEYFRIFEIRNGNLEIIHSIVNPSGTLYEYPVVVDLSGTGKSSNIVLASNNYAASSFYKDAGEEGDQAEALQTTGVRAFKSTGESSWMPTRTVWNQFSFHPDLVNSKSQMIAAPKVNASHFRRNTQSDFGPTVICK